MTARECPECGADLAGAHAYREFCGDACKRKFHNRRQLRGAQLYDVFMTHRCERALGEELHCLTMANRLAAQWRDEDAQERAGRKSWLPVRRLLELNPWLKAVALGQVTIGRM